MPRVLVAVIMLAVLLAGTEASAQAVRQRFSRGYLETFGGYAHTRLSMTIDHAPAGEAIAALSAATGVSITHAGARTPAGFDPDLRISLRMQEVTGLDALELILDRAEDFAPLTWQVRDGWIEYGTRSRLARRRESRVYPVRDLMLDAAYFIGPGGGGVTGLGDPGPTPCQLLAGALRGHQYASASLMHPGANGMYAFPDDPCRLGPGEELNQLLRLFVEMIEPGNWNWRSRRADPTVGSDRLIRVQRFEDRIILLGPDYVHRLINGLPRAPSPRLDVETCLQRSEAAARAGIDVVVHGATEKDTLLPAASVLADRLVATMVEVSYEETPIRTVLDDLGKRVGVPVVGRFADDRLGYGIEPATVVTLSTPVPTSALDVLEQVVRACESGGIPCTWQIRLGYVEVGTKRRLSVPAARELRRYEITDLLLHVPNFSPDGRSDRKHPTMVAIDLVEEVVTTIEPGSWDYGQIPDDDPGSRRVASEGDGTKPPTGRGARRPGSARPSPVYREPVRPASIRLWRKQLFVLAPDYVHRQINGYRDE